MFAFRCFGFRHGRSAGSWLSIGLLLLVIYLLVLDPDHRRPFLARTVLVVAGAVEAACHWVRDRTEPHVAPAELQDGIPEIRNPTRNDYQPIVRQTDRGNQLPADFQAALAQEVEELDADHFTDRWMAVRTARDRRRQIDLAVELARELPPRWWPVDGELVHDLDLPALLSRSER